MKILQVKSLEFPEVKVISYAHFNDERGFFTEVYRKSDFQNNPQLAFMKNFEFNQTNVSYSKKGVIRGLHFQWDPYIAKLARTVQGRMIDLFLDIRKNSPTFGKIGAYNMPAKYEDQENQWIWIPVGFAHGGVYLEDSSIEYFCTGEYNPQTEAGISPIANDIDWSVCDKNLRQIVSEIIQNKPLISEKDKKGHTVSSWKKSPNSDNFLFKRL